LKYLIFGAGEYGKKAIIEYGAENVLAFIDNNVKKQGDVYFGKEILSLDTALSKYKGVHIIIASIYSSTMIMQLEDKGICDYSIYVGATHGYYETSELIVNPYIDRKEAESEQEWSEADRMVYMKQAIYDEVERIHDKNLLFNHIEVETINRCNGVCSFCPVNKNQDPREYAKMEWSMFESIVSQLEEIDFSGRFTTFSNNEPLLDERIIEWNRYAREHLPHARMHLFTNGTLLTLDKFVELIGILDELIIDNYNQNLELIKPCKEIADYCEEHEELKKKVSIVLRKPREILTTRGGNAPNRSNMVEYPHERCILPFRQIIVRPTGQISLCCNDALGKYTLGDLNKNSLLEIWNGPRFQMVRKCLYEGRENWGNCKYCDNFSIG